jgi:hypothetical protein
VLQMERMHLSCAPVRWATSQHEQHVLLFLQGPSQDQVGVLHRQKTRHWQHSSVCLSLTNPPTSFGVLGLLAGWGDGMGLAESSAYPTSPTSTVGRLDSITLKQGRLR